MIFSILPLASKCLTFSGVNGQCCRLYSDVVSVIFIQKCAIPYDQSNRAVSEI